MILLFFSILKEDSINKSITNIILYGRALHLPKEKTTTTTTITPLYLVLTRSGSLSYEIRCHGYRKNNFIITRYDVIIMRKFVLFTRINCTIIR